MINATFGIATYKARADVMYSCEYEIEATSLDEAKRMIQSGDITPVSSTMAMDPLIVEIEKLPKEK